MLTNPGDGTGRNGRNRIFPSHPVWKSMSARLPSAFFGVGSGTVSRTTAYFIAFFTFLLVSLAGTNTAKALPSLVIEGPSSQFLGADNVNLRSLGFCDFRFCDGTCTGLFRDAMTPAILPLFPKQTPASPPTPSRIKFFSTARSAASTEIRRQQRISIASCPELRFQRYGSPGRPGFMQSGQFQQINPRKFLKSQTFCCSDPDRWS